MKRWYMYGGRVRRWFRWRNEYWIVSDHGDRIGPFRDFDKAQATLRTLNIGHDFLKHVLSHEYCI